MKLQEALPELLGTPKDKATLMEFIQNTGAFTFTKEKYTPKVLTMLFEEPKPPDMDSEESRTAPMPNIKPTIP